MDIENIFNKKNISKTSINLYLKNIIRLNDNKEIKNINFLKDTNLVMKKIDDKAKNTQRSYIVSIISLLKELNKENENKYKTLYNDYFDILEILNNNLKNKKNINKILITNDELKNIYIENKMIINIINNKKILNNIEYEKLLNFVIFSLYYLMPPKRNMDYQLMNVVNEYNENLDKKNNYLILKNKQFIFNKYKNNGKYKTEIININKDLMEILNIYLKYHPKKENNYKLLMNFNGKYLKNNNDITRILNKIFKSKISTSVLRKIYNNNNY